MAEAAAEVMEIGSASSSDLEAYASAYGMTTTSPRLRCRLMPSPKAIQQLPSATMRGGGQLRPRLA